MTLFVIVFFLVIILFNSQSRLSSTIIGRGAGGNWGNSTLDPDGYARNSWNE